jgi:hypothetical protein
VKELHGRFGIKNRRHLRLGGRGQGRVEAAARGGGGVGIVLAARRVRGGDALCRVRVSRVGGGDGGDTLVSGL